MTRTSDLTLVPAANSDRAATRQRGRPFPKGVSGNPSGRPKRDLALAELARAYTHEAIRTLAEIMTNPNAPASSRIAAAIALLDRGYGRAPQSLEVDQRASFSEELELFIRQLATCPNEKMIDVLGDEHG
jgi:hypothetical protein